MSWYEDQKPLQENQETSNMYKLMKKGKVTTKRKRKKKKVLEKSQSLSGNNDGEGNEEGERAETKSNDETKNTANDNVHADEPQESLKTENPVQEVEQTIKEPEETGAEQMNAVEVPRPNNEIEYDSGEVICVYSLQTK